MNITNTRKVILGLAASVALLATSHPVSAAAPIKTPGCWAREALVIQRDPGAQSPVTGNLPSGTQVFILGKMGGWTNLWGVNGDYYAYGWTKGKFNCN